MRGLEVRAASHLDARLSGSRDRPIAVAFSGGGDSFALLLIADAWARARGRELIVLTVDHRLSPQSREWTAACQRTAERLGRPFRALAWEGEKPQRGLPAAARAARHTLLAGAARDAGAAVILMGHTADDVLEALRMRAGGSTTPSPWVWGPSPVWPQGRGVFLLRPLLEARRSDLRDWLLARNAAWIDDPANVDPTSARARARLLARHDRPLTLKGRPPLDAPVTEQFGMLTVERAALPDDQLDRFIAIASVCAGGGDRRPATTRIARVAARLRAGDSFACGLAGARIEADAVTIRVFREAGEVARGGLPEQTAEPGRAAIWDGRFELSPAVPVTIRPIAGAAARLPREQQAALRRLPAAARGALPALVEGQAVSCPLLAPAPQLMVRSLVGERYRAAAGLIGREPD